MEIFKKVPQSEKRNLFRKLAENKESFIIKGIEDVLFTFQVLSMAGENHLECEILEQQEKFPNYQENVVINFNLDNDRYFFITTVFAKENFYHIRIDTDIYSLQRRKNIRLPIPKEYTAKFELKMHNGKPGFHKCLVKDVSAGGAQLYYSGETPLFMAGDVLQGTLFLGKKNPIDLAGVIRHAVNDKNFGRLFGFQYMNVDRILENRLYMIMMDLQRELFVNFNKD